MARVGLTLAVLALVGTSCSVALADERIAVRTAGCSAASWRPFFDQLAVELADDHVTIVAEGSDAALALQLDADACGPNAVRATLTATKDGAAPVSRTVPLDGVATDARARVLALAAAELLRAARALRPSAPEPKAIELRVHFDPPASAPPPPPPPPPPARGFVLGATAEARVAPLVGSGFFGARFAFAAPIGPVLAFTADAGFGVARAHDVLGDVTSFFAGGAVGLALAAGPPGFRLHVGPKLEVDALGARGTALAGATGASLVAPVVLGLASATLHARVTPALLALVGFDAGVTLLGYRVDADQRTVGGLDGPILGLRIGLGFGPGVP